MDIIPIDDSSVKISLSEPDMRKLNVSCEDMNYKSTSSRRALWQVLDNVKTQTGFDAANGNIEVRAVTSRDGGCELFVKKSNVSSGGEQVAYAKENYRISAEKPERAETVSYRFDSLDALSLACRQLCAKAYVGESRVHFDESGGKYFLILNTTQKTSSSRLLRTLTFLSEFGQRCDAPCADSYIKEHYVCICGADAVKIIAENC